jgi:hypothetical protein
MVRRGHDKWKGLMLCSWLNRTGKPGAESLRGDGASPEQVELLSHDLNLPLL